MLQVSVGLTPQAGYISSKHLTQVQLRFLVNSFEIKDSHRLEGVLLETSVVNHCECFALLQASFSWLLFSYW